MMDGWLAPHLWICIISNCDGNSSSAVDPLCTTSVASGLFHTPRSDRNLPIEIYTDNDDDDDDDKQLVNISSFTLGANENNSIHPCTNQLSRSIRYCSGLEDNTDFVLSRFFSDSL